MKLSHVLLALTVCTGLVFAQAATEPAKAEPAATPAAPAKAAKAQAGVKITGTVVSVDAIGNTIVVKVSKKKDDTVSVTTDTKIMSGGKTVALADIKTDEKVRVTCKKEEGKMIATEIKVVPVAPAKKSEATPPAGK